MKNSWANDDGGGISLCSIDAGCDAQAILDNGNKQWNVLKYNMNTMLYKDALATEAKLTGGKSGAATTKTQEEKDNAGKTAVNSLVWVALGGVAVIGIVGAIMYKTQKNAGK